MEEFKKLGLSDNIIKALEKKGFTKPTTIQAKAIPLLLEGKVDVIGQSQTGTGKTASFALPIIQKLNGNSKTVQAIILTPTRELALQVTNEIESLKGDKSLKLVTIYGGASISTQRRALERGVDIVVGTPGRVIDLVNRRSLKLGHIKFAVLDEADEMLNMGFIDDIETILSAMPKEKNMIMFSATMPKQILRIAQKYMRRHEIIEVEKSQVTTKNVEQIYYEVNAKDRTSALKRIIDFHIDFYGIIFCKTKAAADTLAQQLARMKYKSAALHGDVSQSQREKILEQFRNKTVKILVATDVAARGIDVNDLTHVVNFSLPQSPESYVHRIGRTGRAGKKGIAITFLIPSERRKLGFVERINNCKLTKQELPSAKQIIKHKEEQMRSVIKEIIANTPDKPSKYDVMAEELLKEEKANRVVSAVLKHFFKAELEEHNYKEMSKYKGEKGTSRSDRGGHRRERSKPRRFERGSDKPRFKRSSEGGHSHKKPRKNTDSSGQGFKRGRKASRKKKRRD